MDTVQPATLQGITDDLRRREQQLQDDAAAGRFNVFEWIALEHDYLRQERYNAAAACRRRYRSLAGPFMGFAA